MGLELSYMALKLTYMEVKLAYIGLKLTYMGLIRFIGILLSFAKSASSTKVNLTEKTGVALKISQKCLFSKSYRNI